MHFAKQLHKKISHAWQKDTIWELKSFPRFFFYSLCVCTVSSALTCDSYFLLFHSENTFSEVIVFGRIQAQERREEMMGNWIAFVCPVTLCPEGHGHKQGRNIKPNLNISTMLGARTYRSQKWLKKHQIQTKWEIPRVCVCVRVCAYARVCDCEKWNAVSMKDNSS